MLKPAQTALEALSRASARARSQPGARPEVLEALSIVQDAARTRVVQGDEEGTTLLDDFVFSGLLGAWGFGLA